MDLDEAVRLLMQEMGLPMEVTDPVSKSNFGFGCRLLYTGELYGALVIKVGNSENLLAASYYGVYPNLSDELGKAPKFPGLGWRRNVGLDLEHRNLTLPRLCRIDGNRVSFLAHPPERLDWNMLGGKYSQTMAAAHRLLAEYPKNQDPLSTVKAPEEVNPRDAPMVIMR